MSRRKSWFQIDRRGFLKVSGVAGLSAVVAYSLLSQNGIIKSILVPAAAQTQPQQGATETTYRTGHANNCDGSCGLEATVVNGNIVMFSNATFNEPDFPPRICLRGLSQLQYVYHPDRLKYPMQRVGARGSGQWQQITWDQATTTIANQFTQIASQYGAQSIYIAPYTGNLAAINGLIGPGYRFASVIGASAGDFEGDNEGDSASPTGAVEELGSFDGHELTDLLNARMIVLWGNNLGETDIPDMRFVLDARDSGTKVVYIDPRYTTTSQLSDQWLSIRPGTDGALALGMINAIISGSLFNQNYVTNYTVGPFLVRQDTNLFLREKDVVPGGSSSKYMVFDTTSNSAVTSDTAGITPSLTGSYTVAGIACKPAFQLLSDLVAQYTPGAASAITGIPASTIQTFAEEFAAANPAAIKAGFGGISHWYYGDLTYRALITLSALCGYIGVHGGGVTTYNGALLDAAIDLPDWITPDKKSYQYLPPISFCDAVLNGNPYPVKAAWFPCDNFVNQQGDTNRTISAIQALDFMVATDVFMTPTAQYADIVLPVATQYEKEDILLGGNMYLQYLPQIIQPMWESKSDLDMFGMVAEKMGQGSYFNQTPDDYISLLLSGLPSGLTLDTLKSQGVVRLADEDFASSAYQPITRPYVPFFQQNFPTPSGRIEFYVESLVPYNMPLPIYNEPIEASPSNPLYQKYPLVLITSHTKFRTHTQWNNLAWLRELNPKQFIEINPQDAAARGINDGDTVTVFNDRGTIQTLARVTSGMRPGTVNIYQGDWQEFPKGTVNMLTHQKINPAQSVVFLFQSNTAYFDVLVDVKKS
ncbi:MAG: molybdopterin-dependent oxidoreductase [Nitrososphaerota archaeon]|nr:molybdopterin-dependent oxidoreductase [Nitrososphaerota archaeon]